MEEEKFHGVDMLINRMQTHPEEFFEHQNRLLVESEKYRGGRWSFIFKEYFHDCLTEAEKGRIHEAIRAVRRMEFDVLVLKELMRDEEAEKRQAEMQRLEQMRITSGSIIGSQYQYGQAQNVAQSALQNSAQSGALGMGLQASPFGAVPKKEEW